MYPPLLLAWARARLGSPRAERGANLVEYMLLLTLIAIVVIVVIKSFGGKVSSIYSSATSQIP